MSVDIIPIPLGFDTCYVLRDRGVIAVDGGQPGKIDVFQAGLEKEGIEPGAVRMLLLTHGHWDHMGSAADIHELTGAPVAVHASEVSWVENANPPLPPGVTIWGRIFMFFHRLAMPLIHLHPAPVGLVFDDEEYSLAEFGIPGRVVHTPGHSPGSVSVVLDSGEAFVGDLAQNRFPLRLTPGLPIFADDGVQVLASWRRLLEFDLHTIYPAHGSAFSADVMRRILARSENS